MKKLFSNSYIILSLYLLFGFLIDIMTNLTLNLSFSIGMIFRGLLLLYLVIGLCFKYKDKNNYIILTMLGLFSCVYLLFQFNFESISYIFKYNFVLILFLYIYNMYKTEDKKINRNTITLSLIFYSICIIIAWLTKSSLESYGISKVGSKGWFNSANEISAIISIIVPYLIVHLNKKINMIEIFAILISLFASILIGTRLPLIAFLVSILYLLFKKIISDVKKRRVNITNIVLLTAFLLIFIFKFRETPVYRNLVVHVKFLKLHNPVEIFTNFKLFDHFIFNERLSFLTNINKLMVSAPISDKLFGLTNITKTVEMDLFDIFYRYGVVGFSMFVFFVSYIIKKLKNRRGINYLPIMFIIISSFLSGHVILSPNVAIISIVVLSNSIFENERKKTVISCSNLTSKKSEMKLKQFIKKVSNDQNDIIIYTDSEYSFNNKDKSYTNIQLVFVKTYRFRIIQILSRLNFLVFNFKEYNESYCLSAENENLNFITRHSSNKSHIYLEKDYIKEVYINNLKSLNEFLKTIKLDKFNYIILNDEDSKTNLLSLYPRFADKIILKDK